jgi:ferredoxin--NADP+ reductase
MRYGFILSLLQPIPWGMKEDSIEFIIKRDNAYDEEGNVKFTGVGSNYMCDLKEGDEVTMTGTCG